MRLEVRTLWQGLVAVRGKYLRQALETGEGIVIVHDGQEMKLDKPELFSLRVSVSEEPVLDKYGNNADHLHYYEWKPTVEQRRMF